MLLNSEGQLEVPCKRLWDCPWWKGGEQMLFAAPKNKLSQMRFEGQQTNSPWTTHVSDSGAVDMPVEARGRVRQHSWSSAHKPCTHMEGVSCAGCKWRLCSTRSYPWVVSGLKKERDFGCAVQPQTLHPLQGMQRCFYRQVENTFNSLLVQVASRQSTGSYIDWSGWAFLLLLKNSPSWP